MLTPSLICAVISTQLITLLRLLLEQWERSQVDALGLGVPVEFDFIRLLGLETVQSWLIRLDDQRLTVILNLLGNGLDGVAAPGTVFAVLDVRKAKLHTFKAPNPRLNVLLRGEAASFATIYSSL